MAKSNPNRPDMTWAQGTFAFCFGILVPLVGILCAARLKRERKPWLKGLILGSATTFLALVGCCFIAVFCYPHYRTLQQPPELLANAFALPGVAAGIAAVWFVSDARTASRRFCTIASVGLLITYIGGLGLCHEAFTWPFRKALPWSAQDIHEWCVAETLLPDYSYQLKARISEQQFRDYIARFGLTPHTPSRAYSDPISLTWDPAPELERDWWDPSESLDATFVRQGNRTWTLAKYEHGFLYLASTAY
jgi:hypothetical protein